MATIKHKGPGGGKVRAKRVSRTWMIKTILAQQKQLDKFSQQLNELQVSVAKTVPTDAVFDIEQANVKLEPFKPARLGTPEGYLELKDPLSSDAVSHF